MKKLGSSFSNCPTDQYQPRFTVFMQRFELEMNPKIYIFLLNRNISLGKNDLAYVQL